MLDSISIVQRNGTDSKRTGWIFDGEHVYQVGELGVVVHNACEGIYVFTTTTGKTYVGVVKGKVHVRPSVRIVL